MGGKKRDYVSLSKLVKQTIDDAVKIEVGRRWATLLDQVGKENTTALEDTILSMKYYATAKCMMLRAIDEMQELTSYMAALDTLPDDLRNKKKTSKLYQAKQERYENLEAEVYKLQTWLNSIDYAVSQLESETHRKWIVGKYMLEKTDAEMSNGIPGISGRNGRSTGTSKAVEDALNVLKYHLFPLKALQEDVLGIKNRKKLDRSLK